MALEKQPNILFIFSDQQRADTIGFEVNGNPVTPNLCQLASEGVLFQNAFTCQPLCGPARACIQTGTYSSENGIFRNGVGLDAQPQNHNNTIAYWLSQAGYETGYIGKWHLASNGGRADFDHGEQKLFHNIAIPPDCRGGYRDFWLGVDALEHSSHGYNGMEDKSWKDGINPKGFMFNSEGKKVEFEGYRVDCQTDFIIDYIKTRKNDRPWFLFTSFIEPHHQNDHNRYEGPEGSKERFAITKDKVPKDLWGADWLMKGDWEENYPDYLGQCWSLDRNVQRMVDTLKELGIYENTLIIYTSDHGSHFRTREGEYKRNCTDGCLKVPMIIRGPGFTGGKVIDELTSILDLVPTMLETASAPIPKHIRGRKLQDLIEISPNSQWTDYIFAQIGESQVGRCIRTKKWKYAIRAPGLNGSNYSKSRLYMEEFLFDLEKDPYELVNLVADQDYEVVRKELSLKIITHMVSIGEERPRIIPSMKIPDPPLLGETGTVIMNEDGIICLKLNGDNNKNQVPMDVPLAELLEELIDTPIALEIRDEKYFGQFQTIPNKADDEDLQFQSFTNEKKILSQMLQSYIGKSISLIVLLPSTADLEMSKAQDLKYHLLFSVS
jgi:uncharacterized sulfatase